MKYSLAHFCILYSKACMTMQMKAQIFNLTCTLLGPIVLLIQKATNSICPHCFQSLIFSQEIYILDKGGQFQLWCHSA